MKALIKFLPIIVFALLIAVVGCDVMIAAMISTFCALFIAMPFTHKKFGEVFEVGVEGAKVSMSVLFIVMIAYAVAEVFLATGVGASIINIALDFGISARSVALVGFLVTCVLSVATGTSWGTFAACAPVFLWLNYIVGGNLILTISSIVGGCAFGDNLGLISDTTVMSSGLQGVQIPDRIRHQGVWSLGCLVLSAICIFAFSINLSSATGNPLEAIDSITPEAWTTLEEERPSAVLLLEQVQQGVPVYMVIPVAFIVISALCKVTTMACLGGGIVTALILGLIAGTIPDLDTFFNVYIYDGMASAGGWAVIIIMWISAFAGIMRSMNAFEPIYILILKVSKKVRHMMTCNALFCILVNLAFGDESSEIVATGPILRELVEENVDGSEEDIYKLKLRNAAFADALGIYSAQFIPWHACVVFYLSIANAVFPLHTFTHLELIHVYDCRCQYAGTYGHWVGSLYPTL